MDKLHLLHISDLHYTGNAEDIRRAKSLVEDINSTISKQPTSIMFTGDLTYSGRSNEFSSLAENLIFEINGYTGLYTCPGNHDIERDKTTPAAREAAIKTSRNLKMEKTPASVFSPCPLQNYFDLHRASTNFSDTNFFTSIGRGDNYEVVSINTAWCCGHHEKPYTDKGNLKVNEISLDSAIESLSQEKFKVLMMHHPLGWLDYTSQKYLNEVISRNFDLVLYGHEHDPNIATLRNQSGESVFCEATAAKANWSNGLNGYSLITVDLPSKAIKITHRSFSATRGIFISGNDVVEGAISYPRESDRDFWRRHDESDSTHLLGRASQKVSIENISSAIRANSANKAQSDENPLTPYFRRVQFQDGDRQYTPREPLTDCLKTLTSTIFFVGPKDCGLSTASHIAFRELSQQIQDRGTLPVYADADDMSSINKASLTRLIQRASIERFTSKEAEALATSGNVAFIFDSVSIHDIEKIQAIRATIENFMPGCKAIIFCSLDQRTTRKTSAGRVSLDPSTDTIYEICELTVQEIRELIDRKAPLETMVARENLLNNAITSFKAMGEPIYPTTVSILVETLKQLPDFRPINRVRLLDRYIECLLGRYTLEDVTIGKFNSSEKSNLLSFIAGTMIKESKESFSTEEIQELINSYSELMLLEIPSKLLSEFCDKGILVVSEDQYTFRANSIFSYFAAKEMARRPDIFNLLTEGDLFFSYNNEIVYFGELEGVDSTRLLEVARSHVETLGASVIKGYAEAGISFSDEWIKLVSEDTKDSSELKDTLREISKQVPTPELKDHSRTNELGSEPRYRGVSRRATVTELEARWFISIRVYLQLLKYSSSIPGPEKLAHLDVALSALESFAHNLAVKREEISSAPVFSHGGVLYINPSAAHNPDKSRRDFKFNAPATVAKMASDLMGTSQLGMALSRASRTTNEFHEFVIRTLLMDIPSADNADYVVKSIANSQTSALQISSLRTLRSKYVSYRSSAAEEKHHRSIIEGLNKEKNIRSIVDFDRIERNKNLSDIKAKLETKKGA